MTHDHVENDNQVIQDILAEDARRIGAHPATPASPPEDVRRAYENLEAFLQGCAYTLGVEEHGMPRGIRWAPDSQGITLCERSGGPPIPWAEVPDAVLAACKPWLPHLQRQVCARSPRHQAKFVTTAQAVLGAPPSNINGTAPKTPVVPSGDGVTTPASPRFPEAPNRVPEPETSTIVVAGREVRVGLDLPARRKPRPSPKPNK